MSLVTGRSWVYPADVDGRYRAARRAFGWALIVFLVGMPWLRVGGLPAVRFDFGARRALLLGSVWTPHDTWALALVGLLAGLSLFLFTAVLGRVWCGWGCPQTVWLEWVFRPLERLIEGSANKRRKLDAGPRDARWWVVKTVKWTAFAALSGLWTAAFLTWFVGGPELVRGEISATAAGVGLFLWAIFFLDVVWFREQFCHYVCPYARFQGALMDRHSLVVAYDPQRGEPRRLGRTPAGGDCIDCRRCVEVCPSGIDIRDGDQLQCVACAACADACDQVMIKIGKPQGLVRYTADRDTRGQATHGRVFGKRAQAYIAALMVISALLALNVARRSPIEVASIRARDGEIFRVLPDGRVLNRFRLHVTNASAEPHRFTIEAAEGTGVEVTVPGQPYPIPWGQERQVDVFLSAPASEFTRGRMPVRLRVIREDGAFVDDDISMLGPEVGTEARAGGPAAGTGQSRAVGPS